MSWCRRIPCAEDRYTTRITTCWPSWRRAWRARRSTPWPPPPGLEQYRLAGRVRDRGRARANSRAIPAPPCYITGRRGPRPERPGQRLAWSEGVAVIERHRSRFGIADPVRALGVEPTRVTARTLAHRDAARDLDRASAELARAGASHRLSIERSSISIEMGRSVVVRR